MPRPRAYTSPVVSFLTNSVSSPLPLLGRTTSADAVIAPRPAAPARTIAAALFNEISIELPSSRIVRKLTIRAANPARIALHTTGAVCHRPSKLLNLLRPAAHAFRIRMAHAARWGDGCLSDTRNQLRSTAV